MDGPSATVDDNQANQDSICWAATGLVNELQSACDNGLPLISANLYKFRVVL